MPGKKYNLQSNYNNKQTIQLNFTSDQQVQHLKIDTTITKQASS